MATPEDLAKDAQAVGEWDEDDIDEINRAYAESHGYIIEGFRCPAEYVTILAPMEFEELVGMFKLYDANGSGTIDKHEARKILLNLGLDASLERAEELLSLVDSDGSGEIEFPEFCRFIVMIKQGDERLGAFSDLLSKMHSTPLGALEHQCKLRDLSLKFITIEEREATATNPALMVVECHLAGIWYSFVDGVVVSKFENKIHQGLGKSIREAKYAAAQAAIVKLKEAMPGVKYKEGDIPEDWMAWINENLERGVEPSTIVTILATKGFHAYRNLGLMHRVLVWKAFEEFLKNNPGFVYDEDTCQDPYLRQFIEDCTNRGIDGLVITQVLFDRAVNLKRYDPYLAQQLSKNQLGSIVGENGTPGELLDFWVACSKGYYDDVLIYCSCKMPVDEERIGRHSGKLEKPIHLAATGGHTRVVECLIKFGAQVNGLDTKGRTALHCAANNGHTKTCLLLLENSARVFGGDFEGNMPMHLAALNNHYDCLHHLCLAATDFTRSVTSDRVRCRPTTTFNAMCEEVYDTVCDMKLKKVETKRFQKEWLCDATHVLISKMDKEVNHMLAKGSEDVMWDVLRRFDPRPEAGVFIIEPTTASQLFVPTIPSPFELSILLKYMFRQSALDSFNNFKRTPLHMACDANRLDSHYATINNLINVHGANVFLLDLHKHSPLDLLILDRKFGWNIPSSQQVREETIRDKRQDELNKFSAEFDEEDRIKTAARRSKILNDCQLYAESCSTPLWEIIREGSILKWSFGFWKCFEDPDSKNLFYCLAPENSMIDNKWNHFTWRFPPDVAKILIDKAVALSFLTQIRSEFKRKVLMWEMYLDKWTNTYFFYNRPKGALRYVTPKEIKWNVISKSSKYVDKLGFSGEWHVCKDAWGNIFYRHKVTRECVWDKPRDAVKALPVEQYCTAYQFKSSSIEQLWYTCEDCNRQWKNKDEGATAMLRLCEPCVWRCHKGHKGIRPMRTQSCICNCQLICKALNCACQARVISKQQTMTQKDGVAARLELRRKLEYDMICPPVFAMVPPVWPDGSPKIVSGWQMCRRTPFLDNNTPMVIRRQRKAQGIIEKDEEEFGIAEYGDPEEKARRDDNDKRKQVDDGEASSAISPGKPDDASMHSADDGATVDTTLATESMHDDNASAVGGGSSVLAKEIIIEADSEFCADTTESGSLYFGKPATYKLIKYLEAHGDDPDVLALRKVDGLPEDWIEVMDCEETEELKVGERVLISPADGYIKQYGNVLEKCPRGMYLCHIDVYPNIPGEKKRDQRVPRSRIQKCFRPVFYCNVKTGESAWTKEAAFSHPFTTKPIRVAGPTWLEIYQRSDLRRIFSNRDEMSCQFMDSLFYIDLQQFNLEKATLRLQRNFRNRARLPLPSIDWDSKAFSMHPPDHIIEEMGRLSGWSYLRRRATILGDLRDAGGNEWEEIMDRDTSEYFYYCEDDNSYLWDKPPLPQHSRKKKVLLKVGDEMMYRFPGRRVDDPVYVTRVRFDDETGDDMYDIVDKYVSDKKFIWVHRLQLKNPPKEGDALNLQKMERTWINIIRRRNEADDRAKKRARQQRLEEEANRMKLLKQLALEAENGNLVAAQASVSAGESVDGDGATAPTGTLSISSEAATRARIGKQRMIRINQESTDLKSEKEKEDTLRRHNKVKEEIERIKNESETILSRADVLSLSRSLDLKIRLEERIKERDVLQKSLNLRKEEGAARVVRTELHLKTMEEVMTTPRSLQRRKLARNLHFAMQRQSDNFMVCEWGCADWVRVGYDQVDHQNSRCCKRILPCTLGCPLKMSEENWLKQWNPPTEEEKQALAIIETVEQSKKAPKLANITIQQNHETDVCPKRLICCPRNCLEWVCAEVLQVHLDELCTRRPAKPIFCRLGCGQQYGGVIEKLIEAEDERLMHEQEQCIFRVVRCNWKFDDGRSCAAQMMAKDRDEHRDFHLALMGITTYLVPGIFHYKIPKGVYRLKVQLWGGGGGSGFFKLRQEGQGGGAAFVEAILEVEPYDVLEVQVGEGGQAGVIGTEVLPLDIDEQRSAMLVELKRRTYLPKDQRGEIKAPQADVIDATCGVAPGGSPGGGTGYGGGGCWAAGGGGGYSIVSKRTLRGNQALLVAAGGGGGGSIAGLPGSGMDGVLPGTRLDPINGETATVEKGGPAGDSGSVFNAEWPASDGTSWRGGDGSEYGAGGGGGYFGGGGGGTNPGIGGGGGGGSSYVYLPKAHDYVIVCGNKYLPGGLKHKIPDAAGIGEWDKVGGVVGQGGCGSKDSTKKGNNGGVRIFKPGHF